MAGHLLGWLGPVAGRIVGGYWPIGSEIDPRPALHRLIAAGARIALPVTPPPGQPLAFRGWHPGMGLTPGRFGLSEPVGELLEPDILLVPLLAFDARCHRLGHGGGYYDRTLAARPAARAIGCAYAGQRVEKIPAGPHDIRLHAVASERGIIEPEG